mgnify:CR=1 FL=1
MSNFALYTAPAIEPVTLQEAKNHLHVTYTDEDALIAALIVAARQSVEQYTWRALLTQTWDMYLDDFPGTNLFWNTPFLNSIYSNTNLDILLLPKGRLQSVTHVKYYDTANAEQTMALNTDYQVDTIAEPARLRFVNTYSVYDKLNAVNIRYVCGWAQTLGTAVAATSVDVSTDTITKSGHGLYDGDCIQLSSLGSVTGVSADTNYFIVNKTATTFQLAATVGGPVINLTGANTTAPTYKPVTTPNVPQPLKQAMLLHIGQLFAMREAVTMAQTFPLSMGSQYLCDPYRLFRF